MKLIRRLVIPAAIAISALAAVQATAAAATSSPSAVQTAQVVSAPAIQSAHGCTFGSSSGNTRLCFYIHGRGLYVNYMSAEACVVHAARQLHMEITGPSFPRGINDRDQIVYAGRCYVPRLRVPGSGNLGNVVAGTYHAIVWRHNAGGGYTNIGEVSLNVTP